MWLVHITRWSILCRKKRPNGVQKCVPRRNADFGKAQKVEMEYGWPPRPSLDWSLSRLFGFPPLFWLTSFSGCLEYGLQPWSVPQVSTDFISMGGKCLHRLYVVTPVGLCGWGRMMELSGSWQNFEHWVVEIRCRCRSRKKWGSKIHVQAQSWDEWIAARLSHSEYIFIIFRYGLIRYRLFYFWEPPITNF